jgi:hypothetical protein
MNEQEIRAKSLEIAAITLGPFPPVKDEADEVPEAYITRAEAIEKYIREGKTIAP